MADIDRGQLLTGGLDLFHQLLRVVTLELGIDQRHFVWAADNLGRDREYALFARVVHFQGQRISRIGEGAE
ncbi:hypothetical protein D3C80_1945820 [compost metagenome]